jgi:hypothetical protein
MPIDAAAGLYTAPSGGAAVCDDCGDRDAPGGMILVRQLRSFDRFLMACDIREFALARSASTPKTCGGCQGPVADAVWDFVSVRSGEPVCDGCVDKSAMARLLPFLRDGLVLYENS